MRPNSIPPRHTTYPAAQPNVAAQPPRILRFKAEDLERAIHFLPPEKQAYIQALFPKDATGRLLMADASRLNLAAKELAPEEFDAVMAGLKKDKMFMNWGRMSEADAAKLKDTGRFSPVDNQKARRPTPDAGPKARRPTQDAGPRNYRPAPEEDFTFVPPKAPRPAKGEDLKTPFGFHGAAPKANAKDADLYPPPGAQEKRPSNKPQNRPPASSGNAQGKPNPASAEPKPKTLEEFLAEERAAEEAKRGSQASTQPQVSMEIVPVKSGQGQVEQTGQQNTSTKMSKTQKGILAGGAVLGTALTIGGLTLAGLALTSKDGDSSSNAPAGT